MYHRVRADGDVRHQDVAPTVEQSRFQQHLQHLAGIGEIVELERLLEPAANRSRPRFAITFDDDYAQHVAHALPVLCQVGVPAAFFLSGRVLHGRGYYWWQYLEALVVHEGLESATRALGLSSAFSIQDLAVQCESDAAMRQRLLDVAPTPSEELLDERSIHSLAEAGMTLGFHTVEHPVLSSLNDDVLTEALTFGRTRLAATAGRPIRLFAYPHGKADRRVATATRAAGYRAAWTGKPHGIGPQDDRFLLGRFEPGPLALDAFAIAVAGRLHLGCDA